MESLPRPFTLCLLLFSGWVSRQQQAVIAYLLEENRVLRDLSARELAVIVPVIALCVLMGVYPTPFLSRIEPSVASLVQRFEQHAPTTRVAQADQVVPR